MKDDFIARLKSVEEKSDGNFNFVLIDESDGFYDENGAFNFKIDVKKSCEVTARIKSAELNDLSSEIYVDEVQICAYKPIIDQNTAYYKCYLDKGEHRFKITCEAEGANLELGLFGYVEKIFYESEISLSTRRSDGEIVCFFDSVREKASVYRYFGGAMGLVFEKENVVSATIALNENGGVYFAYVDKNGALKAANLNLENAYLTAEATIDEGVRWVSGTLYNQSPAFFALKSGKVVLHYLENAQFVSKQTGVSGAAKISSSPDVENSVAVIGYNKQATYLLLD